jgi:recombinational DNA repair ATPase RecF
MTTTAHLKSLSVTAFRGASTTFALPFEKARKLTLIYGENGTGKTTICDAFEFLAHERVSSLDGYGLGKALEKYWPTAGKSANDLSIVLETNAGICSAKIVNKKVVVTPADSRPKIELLRRQQILHLIQAQPNERYDAIKRFIDISAFDTSEEALRQQCKALADERSRAHQAEDQSLQELLGFYEAAGSPAGLNPVTWAKQKLADSTADLDGDISAIGKLRSAFDTLKAFPERVESRQKSQADAATTLANAESALAAAAAAVSDGAAGTLAVLEAGSQYLQSHHDATECPLCLSKENAAGLANHVASRLANLGTLRTATAKRQQCVVAVTNAQAAVTQLDADYAKAIATYTTVKDGHKWKAKVKLPNDAPPVKLASLAAWLAAEETTVQTWPAVEAEWRDEKKFTATLKTASDRYEANLTKRSELDLLVPKLDDALKICVERRQAFTSTIIGGIAQEVGKLYEQVHPGEGLDAIALLLDPNKRASIELEAKFSGKEVPPQAYFSQSHLDTLGLCIFLALAARDRPDETILILDDVLGSVDEPHVERIVGMIYEISKNFRHTIVATHYRPWRERFRWGALKPGQPCQFVELSGWDIADGMNLVGCIPEIDRLKNLLAETQPDIQAICSKAGVILEYALEYLTQRYECPVPNRPGGSYTIGELLPAIDSKLRVALRVEIRDGLTDSNASPSSVVQLKPILDELSRIAQVRNALGAHFKAISFELLDQDALGFANHVVQLVDALSHPDDGWPSNDKSGSYWRNSGDSRRLHPLKKPA